MITRNRLAVFAFGCAFSALAGTAALAQDDAQGIPEQPPMMAPADIDETQIDSFAVAYVQVMSIGMQADQQIQAAGSDDERMQIQIQAQQQMAATVESIEGISVDEYNAILQAAQADPELGARVQAAVDAVVTEAN